MVSRFSCNLAKAILNRARQKLGLSPTQPDSPATPSSSPAEEIDRLNAGNEIVQEHSSPSRDLFEHTMLPPGRWFRLLRLLPGEYSDPIESELLVVDFDSAPDYEPISYAWGRTGDRCEITCNRKKYFITASLFHGLQKFRQKHETRLLWADGICINQKDDFEKGSQVGLMAEIYSRGYCTLLWFGQSCVKPHCQRDEKECIEGAISLMREFNGYIVEQYNQMETLEDDDVWKKIYRMQPVPENHPSLRDSIRWSCLQDFWSRSWFSRCWVLQEVGLSQLATVFLGAERPVKNEGTANWQKKRDIVEENPSIDFWEVAFFATVMVDTAILVQQAPLELGRTASAFSDIWASLGTTDTWMDQHFLIKEVKEYALPDDSGPPLTALEVLQAGQAFSASNDRDHIFAFLGHPLLKGVVEADYTHSAEETCQLLAVRLIEQTNSLDTLCFVEHEGELPTSASWVPQWHRERKAFEGFRSDFFVMKPDGNDRAGHVVDNKLHVKGLIVDSIVDHSDTIRSLDIKLNAPVHGRSENIAPEDPHIFEVLWKMYSKARESSDTEFPEPWGSFTATLLHGIYDDHRFIKPDFLAYSKRHFSQTFHEALEKDIEFRHLSLVDAARPERFHGHAERRSSQRKFIVTATGHCGLGPHLTQKSCVLAVVFGCTMPLILQPTNMPSEYRVVGPCYLRELMKDSVDNWAVRGWKSGSIKRKEIILV